MASALQGFQSKETVMMALMGDGAGCYGGTDEGPWPSPRVEGG